MNLIRYILFTLIMQVPIHGVSQFSFHNFGNIRMHEDAQIGFHQNLINDGSFDGNLGLVGFYNDDTAFIYGAFKPVFHDVEVVVANNIFLEVGLGITNNSNFILGDVVTPRNLIDVNLDYIDNAFYNGDDDFRKIDGYSALTNKKEFTFPIGDDDRLRALSISSLQLIPNAKSAYFFENPDFPSTFPSSFVTTQKAEDVDTVSTFEFWYLDGTVPSWVTISWDEESNLSSFIDDIENLKVIGWHSGNKQWENLGGLKINGDFDSGQITSDIFMPNDYTIITFGSSLENVLITLDNYILTPNGDGINDYLKIEEVERSPNNELKIFNRWGRLVYSKENYKNTFVGKANVNMVVEQKLNLPDGIYFYIINLKDLKLKFQGYMYIIE